MNPKVVLTAAVAGIAAIAMVIVVMTSGGSSDTASDPGGFQSIPTTPSDAPSDAPLYTESPESPNPSASVQASPDTEIPLGDTPVQEGEGVVVEEEPYVAHDEGYTQTDENSDVDPMEPEWTPYLEKFASAYVGNASSKKAWNSRIKPLVYHELYDQLKIVPQDVFPQEGMKTYSVVGKEADTLRVIDIKYPDMSKPIRINLVNELDGTWMVYVISTP